MSDIVWLAVVALLSFIAGYAYRSLWIHIDQFLMSTLDSTIHITCEKEEETNA